MHSRRPVASGLLLTAAVFLCGSVAIGGVAQAQRRAAAKAPYRYYMELTGVKPGKAVPAAVATAVTELVRKRYLAAAEKHPRLLHALHVAAPDRTKNPKAFKAYLLKNRIKAFLVGMEIKRYEESTADLPPPNKGKRMTVRIAVHSFGETLPGRTIAFVSDGSATVKIDVGKRVRKSDARYGRREATDQALISALNEAVAKLDKAAKVVVKKKRRRRRKRRRRSKK